MRAKLARRAKAKQICKKLRSLENVNWADWNAETYQLLDVEPLSKQYRRDFDKPYPIALISLFSVENIGIRYLYAFLKEAGFDVDLIFLKGYALNHYRMPTEKELQLLFDLFRQRGYKLIGFGARSAYIKFGVELTDRIHDELDVPVVWGGTVGTVTPELCIAGGADFCVQDEAETAMSRLINCLAKGEDWHDIENLWYPGEDGEPKGNPLRQLIPTLDVLPMQDLEDDHKYFIEHDEITEGDPWRDVVKFETLTARGCPYKCSFCIHSQLVTLEKGLGKSVRGASVEKIMRELEYAVNKLPNMKSIFFTDEVFGTGTPWVREFARVYPERINLLFELCIDPRALSDEKVGLLVKSGLAELNMGLQAGSEKIRAELFDRPVSTKRMLEVANLMKKHGVFTRYDIIVDNPWENSDDKRATLDMLLQLPHPFILNMYSLNWFPKTTLTERAIAEGVIDDAQVSGQSDKTLRQMVVSYDFPRSKEDTFWNALYNLSSKWMVPRSFIRFLADLSWLKEHPRSAVALARGFTILRLCIDCTVMLWQGRLSFAYIRRMLPSLGSITR